MVAPITDEELAEIEATPLEYPPFIVLLVARLRAAEARAETAERERDEARSWSDEDADDQWSDAIDDAFPTRSGSHEEYGTAMAMVGHRRSKASLVALVNWLLVRIKADAHVTGAKNEGKGG